MATHWKRPESVPFPSVWCRCQGKKPMSDGSIPKFRIQDLTDELAEEAIDHMCSIFLNDETMCSTVGVTKDLVSLEEIREIWRDLIKQRVALVALVDNDDDPPRIAGVNMTGVAYIDDPEDMHKKYKGESLVEVFKALEYASHLVDVFKKYNVEEYMTALGLSVAPEFRGQGLGLELLKARSELGKAVGLKLTVTVFTGIESQIQARRAGFEFLGEVIYSEYRSNGKIIFPNTKVKSFQLMAKRIE